MDLATKLENNVKARRVANEIVEMGILLAKEEGLTEHPESTRKMWQHVIETVKDLIGSGVPSAGDQMETSCPLSDSEDLPWDAEQIDEKQSSLDFFTERADLARQVSTVVAEASPDDEPFPFGKHGPKEGQLSYGEVPDNYYGWLSQQHWVADRWPEVAAYIEAKELE